MDLPRPERGSRSRRRAPWCRSSSRRGITFVRAPEVWARGLHRARAVVAGGRHRLPLDPPRAAPALPRLERHHGRPRLQLARLHPPAGGGICGANSTAPCDDNGHGTHTIGTAIGDDGAGEPGRAWPRARSASAAGTWTRAPARPPPTSSASSSSWRPTRSAARPRQGNPRPGPRRHRQLLGLPAVRGLRRANMELIRQAVAAQRAAGIVTGASAGNSGSGLLDRRRPPGASTTSRSAWARSAARGTCARHPGQLQLPRPGDHRRQQPREAGHRGAGHEHPLRHQQQRHAPTPAWPGHLDGRAARRGRGGAAALGRAVAGRQRGRDRGAAHGHRGAQRDQLDRTAAAARAGVYPNNLFGYGRLDIACGVAGAPLSAVNVSAWPGRP